METSPHHTHFRKQIPVNQLSSPKQPDWIRLPRAGERCPYTNLSRSTLNNLILPCKANKNRPPVRSAVVGQKGANRGVRLIDRQSLMAHIEAGQEPACDQSANATSTARSTPVSQRRTALFGGQTFSIAGKARRAQ